MLLMLLLIVLGGKTDETLLKASYLTPKSQTLNVSNVVTIKSYRNGSPDVELFEEAL
jgi:hypothetical protein